MVEPAERVPAFFKVFLPERSSQRMLIPLAFAMHMKGKIPDEVILKNYQGRAWHVDVARTGEGLFFGNGWKDVVKDNFVELGDFFVFHFDGNCTFNFKLFGSSACEKKITRDFVFKIKEEEEEVYKRNEKKKEGRDVSGDDDYEEEMEEDEEEEEWEWPEVQTVSKKGAGSSRGLRKFGRSTHSEHRGNEMVLEGGEDGCNSPYVIDDEDLFKSGLISRPKNPYFVAKKNSSRPSQLYIPSNVIKDHDIELGPELFLRDQQKSWRVHFTKWKDGRIVLQKGWQAFCRRNNLEGEDRVILEFVQDSGQWSTLLVNTIIRAGSWLPKVSNYLGL